MVKAIVAMSGTILVGQMMQGDTAEALCKAFGTREVERANISSSYQGAGGSSSRSSTLSYNRDEIALYKPSELASRLGLAPDGKGVRMILFTGGDAFELTWPHFPLREERVGHEPAPWTLGVGARMTGSVEGEARAPEEGAKLAADRDVDPGARSASDKDAEDADVLEAIGDPDPDPTGAPASAEEPPEAAFALGATGEEVVVRSRAPEARPKDAAPEPDAFSDAVQALAAESAGGELGAAASHLAQVAEAALRQQPGPREDAVVRAGRRRRNP
jgi:hypothetical protein